MNSGYAVRDDNKCICESCAKPVIIKGKATVGYRITEGVYERHEGECGKCHKPLGREITVKVGKLRYHRECFRCFKCDLKLENEFINIDDSPYCKGCGSNMAGIVAAAKAKKELQESKSKYEADRRKREAEREQARKAREAAFRRNLEAGDSSDSSDDDDDPSPCGVCNKPIGSAAVVIWGGKKHHRRCWVCAKCLQKLDGSTMKIKDGDRYCRSCA